jgi:hypothetical protein
MRADKSGEPPRTRPANYMLTYRQAWYLKELTYQERLDLACKMLRIEKHMDLCNAWFREQFKKLAQNSKRD